jgi:phospholipase/carboxylesterase
MAYRNYKASLKFVVMVAAAISVVWWLSHDPPVEVGKAGADKVVILLHGYGADKQDLRPVALSLSGNVPDVRFILPQAPHSASIGYAWIPSYSADTKEKANALLDQLRAEARQVVVPIIEDLIEDGVAPHNIYVAGFSQGAAVALDVLLHEPAAQSIAGLIFLSGGGFKPDLEMLAGRTQVRAFVSHAKRDPRVNIGGAKRLVAALEAGGHVVEFVEFDNGHTIPLETIQALRDFLQQHP